jgi:photosystem II stability/assembly factor-like uncharacterized protein
MSGWACGNGSVNYYTTDGGLHWAAVPAPGGSTIGSIWFTNQPRGWSVNLEGQIFRSTKWRTQLDTSATVDGTNLQMIQFFDLQEGRVIRRRRVLPHGNWWPELDESLRSSRHVGA